MQKMNGCRLKVNGIILKMNTVQIMNGIIILKTVNGTTL